MRKYIVKPWVKAIGKKESYSKVVRGPRLLILFAFLVAIPATIMILSGNILFGIFAGLMCNFIVTATFLLLTPDEKETPTKA